MRTGVPDEVVEEINSVLKCLNAMDESLRKEAEEKIEILEQLDEYYFVLIRNLLNSRNCFELGLISALKLKEMVFENCKQQQFVDNLEFTLDDFTTNCIDVRHIARDTYVLYFCEKSAAIHSTLMKIFMKLVTTKCRPDDLDSLLPILYETLVNNFAPKHTIKSALLLKQLVTFTRGDGYLEFYLECMDTICKLFECELDLKNKFINSNELLDVMLPLAEVLLIRINKYTTNGTRFDDTLPNYTIIKNFVNQLSVLFSNPQHFGESFDVITDVVGIFYLLILQYPYFVANEIEMWFTHLLRLTCYVSSCYSMHINGNNASTSYDVIGSLSKLTLLCLIRVLQWGKAKDYVVKYLDLMVKSIYPLSIFNEISKDSLNSIEDFEWMSKSYSEKQHHFLNVFTVYDMEEMVVNFPNKPHSDLPQIQTPTNDEISQSVLENPPEVDNSEEYSTLFDNWSANMTSFMDDNDLQPRDLILSLYCFMIDTIGVVEFYNAIKRNTAEIRSLLENNIDVNVGIKHMEAYCFHIAFTVSRIQDSDLKAMFVEDIRANQCVLDIFSNKINANCVQNNLGLFCNLVGYHIYLNNFVGGDLNSQNYTNDLCIFRDWLRSKTVHSVVGARCIKFLAAPPNNVVHEYTISLLEIIRMCSVSYSDYISDFLDALYHLIQIHTEVSLNVIIPLLFETLWKYYQKVDVLNKCCAIIVFLCSVENMPMTDIHFWNSSLTSQLEKPYTVQFSSVFNALCDVCIVLASSLNIPSFYLAEYFNKMMRIFAFDDKSFLDRIGEFFAVLLWNYPQDITKLYDGNGDSVITIAVRLLGFVVDSLLIHKELPPGDVSVLNILLESIIVKTPHMIKNSDMLTIILNLSKLTRIGNQTSIKYATMCFIQLFKTDFKYMVNYTQSIPDVTAEPMIFSIVVRICLFVLSIKDGYIKACGIRILGEFLKCSLTNEYPILQKLNKVDSAGVQLNHSINDSIKSILKTACNDLISRTEGVQESNEILFGSHLKNLTFLMEYYGSWIILDKRTEKTRLSHINKFTEADFNEYKTWLVNFVYPEA